MKRSLLLGVLFFVGLSSSASLAVAAIEVAPDDDYSPTERASIEHRTTEFCAGGDYHLTAAHRKHTDAPPRFSLTIEVFGVKSRQGLGDLMRRGGATLADGDPIRDVSVAGCSANGCVYSSYAIYTLTPAEVDEVGRDGLDAKINVGLCDVILRIPPTDVADLRSWASTRH